MVIMSSPQEVKKDFFNPLVEAGALLILTRVSNIIAEQGVQAYLVGGFLRDVLLDRDTVDIDIAVASDALDIAPKVAEALNGRYVLLDGDNRVGRVVLAGEKEPSDRYQRELDFSTFEGSIEQDLARRDFTINAMAIDLNQLTEGYRELKLIDPYKGRNDIEGRVIRSVAETAFASDPARLLRAVRLAAELGFSIDEQTEAQIQNCSHLLASVASERVREELLRLMDIPGSGQFLPYLDRLGLLTAIVPELAHTKGVKQPKEHCWNVFDHSLRTVIAVDFVLRQGDWEYAGEGVLAAVPWSEALEQHFALEVSSSSTRGVLLKLAALLHDIAKPQTKAIDDNGRMRFLGHGKEGAAVTVGILQRLRFSSKETRLVETLVRHHLRPMQMSQGELPTRRAIYRYFRDTGEAGIDILFLSLADHLATRGPHLNMPQWQEHTQMVEYVLSRYFQQESQPLPAKLVDGHDLLNIFGMSPGPEVGKVLEAVQEAHASGELTTRQEALEYVRDYLQNKGKG